VALAPGAIHCIYKRYIPHVVGGEGGVLPNVVSCHIGVSRDGTIVLTIGQHVLPISEVVNMLSNSCMSCTLVYRGH